MKKNQTKKKACVKFAAGCPRSMLDGALLIDYLKKNGWTLTDKVKHAQLVLLGLCGFDVPSETDSKNIMRIVLRKKKGRALLVPFGCFADIYPSITSERSDIIPLNYKCLEKIDEIISAEIKIGQLPGTNVISKHSDYLKVDLTKFDRIRLKIGSLLVNPAILIMRFKTGIGPKALRPIECDDFFIKISKGCTGYCSYCAIKTVAGHLISYPIKNILRQFENGLSQGYLVFRLLGEDVGGYGNDCGTNIVTLFHEFFRRNADFQFVIEDFSPKWLIRYEDDLIKLFAANAHHIHHIVFPIQSGSEPIVRRMAREYSVKKVVESIAALQAAAPGIKMSTHVIVGFPGETECDFQSTINILKILNFDHIEAHRYSERPNTAARLFKDNIPARIIIKRLWRLRQEFPDSCRIRI